MKTYLLALIAVFALSACTTVHPGQKGISISLGKVADTPLENGVYAWIPFLRSVKTFDTRVQKSVVDTMAASKDLQDVKTELAVNWNVDPASVVNFYKNVGDEQDALEKVINPAVSEVLKAATAKHTAEEIIGQRIALKNDIDKELTTRLTRYGVSVQDISIVNVQFSPEFARAIENKQIAEQQAKQAQYVADKAVKDADAEVNRARGAAKAQELQRSSITPQLLQKMAIDKWDGHFPSVMGTGAMPFLNIKPTSATGN